MRYAKSELVTPAKSLLGGGVALVGGPPVPPDGFGLILGDVPAQSVTSREFVLGGGVALPGGELERLHIFSIAFKYSIAGAIDGGGVLGFGLALAGWPSRADGLHYKDCPKDQENPNGGDRCRESVKGGIFGRRRRDKRRRGGYGWGKKRSG